MRDGVQQALGVARQVRALGQVLAQQAVRVLVGPALPGAVRIGKEDLEREPLGQLLMLGHRRHMGNLAAAVCASRPRLARLARLTQRRQQFTAQGAAGQYIEPRIDRLGRELCAHVVRIRASEASGNLFGRAAFSRCILTYCHSQGSRSFHGRWG